MKKKITVLFCVLLACVLFAQAGCAAKIKSDDLMKTISAQSVAGKDADDEFIAGVAEFSAKLFKQSVSDKENTLVSPLSVLLALAMTANGADKTTLSEMEAVLCGGVPIDTLNDFLYSYRTGLKSENKSKLEIANSIWFRDNAAMLEVRPEFLQANADYYGAAAYKSDFGNQTVKDINTWVKKNTAGMINKIVEEISDDTVMYLINAIMFDAEWKKIYEKKDIGSGTFNAFDGKTQNVKFMSSDESRYLEDAGAKGFIKPYYNDYYSFAALLPNEGTDIMDYIASMNGAAFINTIKNTQTAAVRVFLPKFEYDYSIDMNDALKAMGIKAAFSGGAADFSKLGSSQAGNLYISKVTHKTFISVDERGTKAGAVTSVEMVPESAPVEVRTIKLDRPFVYAIIDNKSKLPVFIGAVLQV